MDEKRVEVLFEYLEAIMDIRRDRGPRESDDDRIRAIMDAIDFELGI